MWGLIFGRPGLDISSILPANSDFTDSYSESSYLADQVLGDLPPLKWQFHRSLIWEIIIGRPVLGIYSTLTKHWFHRIILWELISGRPGLGRSTPLKWQCHRFLLWELIFSRLGLDISTQSSDFTDSYSELIFGRPGLRRFIPSNGSVTDS